MNNNKQRHLVATHVYLGVGLTLTSPPSSLLIIEQAGEQKFIFPVATWSEIWWKGLGEDTRVLKLLPTRGCIQGMFFGLFLEGLTFECW